MPSPASCSDVSIHGPARHFIVRLPGSLLYGLRLPWALAEHEDTPAHEARANYGVRSQGLPRRHGLLALCTSSLPLLYYQSADVIDTTRTSCTLSRRSTQGLTTLLVCICVAVPTAQLTPYPTSDVHPCSSAHAYERGLRAPAERTLCPRPSASGLPARQGRVGVRWRRQAGGHR